MPRVSINVSGTVFEFDGKMLDVHETHTLAKMYLEANTSGQQLKFNIDRPADSFANILAYYQTGELHMPNNVCPKSFSNELNYWNIPASEMEKCCLYRYYGFVEELETHEDFKNYEQRTYADEMQFPSTEHMTWFGHFRRRMWNIIDYKERSILAKVYLFVVFVMILVGILMLALSTVPTLQRNPTKCEYLEYLEYSEHEQYNNMKNQFGNPDCENDYDDATFDDNVMGYPPPSPKKYDRTFQDYYDNTPMGNRKSHHRDTTPNSPVTRNDTTSGPPPPQTTSPQEQNDISLPYVTLRHMAFNICGYIVTIFLSIDFVMRLLSCPSMRRYFTSITNISDIIALAGFYAHIIVIQAAKEHKYSNGNIRLIEYLQIFRSIRLLSVVKNVRASRVLAFSLRQNMRDMTMLLLMLLTGMSISSCLIYFTEDRDTFVSIPQAWYWSIITITTVGYGDLSPKTPLGQTLASLLAICGILLLAITLPMFVNNFLTLYQYSCLDERISKKEKKSEKQQSYSKRKVKATFVSTVAPSPSKDNRDKNAEYHVRNQCSKGISGVEIYPYHLEHKEKSSNLHESV